MSKKQKIKEEEKKDRRIPTTRYSPEYRVGLTSAQIHLPILT